MALLKGLGALSGGTSSGLPGLILGGAAGGKLDKLLDKAAGKDLPPEYQDVKLDPESEALMKRMQERAERSADVVAEEAIEGAPQEKLLERDLRETSGDQALSAAINKRAARDYSESMNEMKRRIKLRAPYERFQRMAGGSDIQDRVAQMDIANAERRHQSAINRRAARNATVGNILGLAGMGIGALAGGVGGAQIGGSVGGAMGGTTKTGYMSNLRR